MRILKFIGIAVIIMTISSASLSAQYMRNLSLGLRSDVGFSIIQPTERYSLFNISTGSDQEIFDKNYEPFYMNTGVNYALVIYYAFSDNFELSFQPGLVSYNYSYYNLYDWTGSQNFSVRYDFKHSSRYIDLPLGIKYRLKGEKIQPYLHLGVHYGFRDASAKYLTKTETGLYGEYEFEEESLSNDSSLLKSNFGSFAGIGLNYKFKHSQIGLEANFRYSFHNITDVNRRYSNNTLSGKYYDIPDDMKLMNISLGIHYIISLKCVKSFPLPQYREY